MTTDLQQGLPPVVGEHAKVLILGSFPSAQSLAARQYYANPRNGFWSIASELFGFGPTAPYEHRLAAIQSHGVALWDVLDKCRRKGSADSAIDPKSLVVNNFAEFFAEHPRIDRVYFNGAKAADVYHKLVPTVTPLRYHRLPSTSPAHAVPLQDKLAAWRVIAQL